MNFKMDINNNEIDGENQNVPIPIIPSRSTRKKSKKYQISQAKELDSLLSLSHVEKDLVNKSHSSYELNSSFKYKTFLKASLMSFNKPPEYVAHVQTGKEFANVKELYLRPPKPLTNLSKLSINAKNVGELNVLDDGDLLVGDFIRDDKSDSSSIASSSTIASKVSKASIFSNESKRSNQSEASSLMSNKSEGSKSEINSKGSDDTISIESGEPLNYANNDLAELVSTKARRVLSMDQLNLIDSVGKAGSKKRGYMVRPGPHLLSRNASEIDLKSIKMIGNVDNQKIDKLVSLIKNISALFITSGVLLIILIWGLCIFGSYADYLKEFLTHNTFSFAFLLGGMFTPIAIGIYSRYAMSNLKHMRPYFLRVPFTFVIPIGFFIYSILYLSSVKSLVKSYLTMRMSQYDEFQRNTHIIWDQLQNTFSCCGIDSKLDWKPYLNSTVGNADYPKSCCIDQKDEGCPDFAAPSSIYPIGCREEVENLHFGIGIFFCSSALFQFVFELLSVALMKKLYNTIQFEMDDYRSACKIIMGKCFSICDAMEYEKRQELAESRRLDYEELVRQIPEESLLPR